MTLFKKTITGIGFFALKQAMVSVCHFNTEAKEELKYYKEGYTIQLKVLPDGPKIAFEKQGDSLRTTSANKENYDLVVIFKTEDIAFRIMTTLSNVPKAFTQNRLMVYGNVADSMVLIRVINIVQSYLFPPILSKRVLKRVPKFNLGAHIGRIRVYTLGLLLRY